MHKATIEALSLIRVERNRQLSEKEYDYEHDDTHKDHELALAAVAYILPPPNYTYSCAQDYERENFWPFMSDFKQEPENTVDDRIKALTKGLALGMAELERFIRFRDKAKQDEAFFK